MAELGEQVLQVTLKASGITARALLRAMREAYQKRSLVTHGEQSVKQLNLQNKALENVDISKEDMATLRRTLNSYGVDFAVARDREQGVYKVFFKGQDVDRVYAALEKCVKDYESYNRRRPVKETLQDAKEEAEKRSQQRQKEKVRVREQEQTPEREKDKEQDAR